MKRRLPPRGLAWGRAHGPSNTGCVMAAEPAERNLHGVRELVPGGETQADLIRV